MNVFGFAGFSGSGKTRLIEQLIPVFVKTGLRVSLVKHAHHDFDLDVPGKDSWRHRQAGCTEVMVSSSARWAIMHELRGDQEPGLDEQLRHMSPVDLVLVEGFKREPIPKLEIWRPEVGKPLLYPEDTHIIAIASTQSLDCLLPQFDLDDPYAIAGFIMRYFGFMESAYA
ncbi:MAG TPA: molybdopterin-guanine dinucleotide biosynthesis protein B [Burkholderiales bacterium]|nr:molybdopterin-guanine dinucleotide biosynthesis protein B [Burkholderiales bacterium]